MIELTAGMEGGIRVSHTVRHFFSLAPVVLETLKRLPVEFQLAVYRSDRAVHVPQVLLDPPRCSLRHAVKLWGMVG